MHEKHVGGMLFLYYFTFFTINSLTSASLSALVLLDNPLHLPPALVPNNNTPLSLPLPPSSPLSLPPPPPPQSTDHISYTCNGAAFGYTLSVDSCSDVVRLIGINTTTVSWGMRNTGPTFDIPLPQRYISADGTCVVEPSIKPGVREARASREDIAVAAFVVVRNCAGGEPSEGGVAKDIGGDNNLRVYVSKYDPSTIRCYGKMHRPDAQVSCQQLLNTMSTSELNTYFGPGSDPLANVRVPVLLLSEDHQCKITIRTTGKGAGRTDMWSWGQFWEGAVAVAGVCVREGKEGVQTGLGELVFPFDLFFSLEKRRKERGRFGELVRGV